AEQAGQSQDKRTRTRFCFAASGNRPGLTTRDLPQVHGVGGRKYLCASRRFPSLLWHERGGKYLLTRRIPPSTGHHESLGWTGNYSADRLLCLLYDGAVLGRSHICAA